jgi:MFS family permease
MTRHIHPMPQPSQQAVSIPAKPARQPFPRVFYVALLATLLFSLGLTSLIPIIPLFITDELNAAEQWIGTATLFIAFASVATRIPGGALSDQHGRRKIMLIGTLLGVMAAGLYTASQDIGVFLLARVTTGLSLALFTTAGKALAADLSPNERRGEGMGLNNAAFSLATVFSPLLGEGLKNTVGFQAVFALYGLLMLMTLGVTYSLPRGKPERSVPPGARRDIKDTLNERGTWAAIWLIVGMGAVLTLMFTFYPLLAERKDLFDDAPRILSTVAMGVGLSIWAITDSVIEPIAGRVSDRIGRQPVTIPGFLLAVAGVISLSQSSSTYNTYLAIVLLATGWGMTRATADAISQDAVPPVLRGMSAAILYTSFDLAIGIDAQLMSGLIDGNDFRVFFYAVATPMLGFGLVGILLSTRLVAYERRAPHPASPLTSGD